MKGEVNQLSKIAVSTREAFIPASPSVWYYSSQYTHYSLSRVVTSVSRYVNVVDHVTWKVHVVVSGRIMLCHDFFIIIIFLVLQMRFCWSKINIKGRKPLHAWK